RLTLYCRNPSGGPNGAVMISSVRGWRRVEGFAPIVLVLVAVLAAALAGCKTTQPTEASLAAAAGDADRRSAPALAERYRAHPDDAAAAVNYARALRTEGEGAQALAVLEGALLQHPKHRG